MHWNNHFFHLYFELESRLILLYVSSPEISHALMFVSWRYSVWDFITDLFNWSPFFMRSNLWFIMQLSKANLCYSFWERAHHLVCSSVLKMPFRLITQNDNTNDFMQFPPFFEFTALIIFFREFHSFEDFLFFFYLILYCLILFPLFFMRVKARCCCCKVILGYLSDIRNHVKMFLTYRTM